MEGIFLRDNPVYRGSGQDSDTSAVLARVLRGGDESQNCHDFCGVQKGMLPVKFYILVNLKYIFLELLGVFVEDYAVIFLMHLFVS